MTVKALLEEISRERWDRKGVRVLAKTDPLAIGGTNVFDVVAIKIEEDALVLVIRAKLETPKI